MVRVVLPAGGEQAPCTSTSDQVGSTSCALSSIGQ
jgi:hypothetical protein